jgi:hypothetical protein
MMDHRTRSAGGALMQNQRATAMLFRESLRAAAIASFFNTLSKLIDDAMAEEWIDLTANPTKHPKVRDALPAVEAPDPEDLVQMSQGDVSRLIRRQQHPNGGFVTFSRL